MIRGRVHSGRESKSRRCAAPKVSFGKNMRSFNFTIMMIMMTTTTMMMMIRVMVMMVMMIKDA